MTRQVFYLDRICMDCGKDFQAAIEEGSGKPLNCWYWGELKLSDVRWTWFYPHFENTNPHTIWREWMKKYIPGYCYPDDEPTVKSIWKRWYILIRGWLANLTTPSLEMWTCQECKEKEELREK